MKHFDMNTRHTQFVELLERQELNAQQRQTLWGWIERAHATDAQRYQSTWVPMIAQHDHHLVEGLTAAPDTKALARLATILPLPCFCLRPPMVDPYEDRGLSAAQLAPILKSEQLQFVSHLDLSGHRFDDECAQRLAQSAHVRHLKQLDLRGTPLTLRGLASLLNADNMPNLQHLRLDHCRRLPWIEGELPELTSKWHALGVFSASSCELTDGLLDHMTPALLTTLHVLDLSQNALSKLDFVCAIPNLHTLIMHNNQLDARCAEVLRSDNMPAGLTRLDLGNNPTGDAPAQAIAQAMHFQAIRHLALYTSDLTDAGVLAIARARLPQLQILDIPFNTFGDQGFGALAQSDKMPGLKQLNCRGNQIGDKGTLALANATIDHLVELELGYNRIGPAGAQALAQCEGLRQLDSLVLEGNPIGAAGAQALAQSPHLKKHIRQQYAEWPEGSP